MTLPSAGRPAHPSSLLPIRSTRLAAVLTAGALAAVGTVAVLPPVVADAAERPAPSGCEAYVPQDAAESSTSSGSGSLGSSGAGTSLPQDATGALECQVPSPSMGREFSVIVRPAHTEQNPKVALFLDGADSGEVNGWVDKAGALDHLAEEDKTLVFPVTDPWTWSQNWDEDAPGDADDAQFETFLVDELPDYLENSFDVPDGGRGTTGVVGLSAGAYATMNIASKHPEQYNSVYALSGIYDPQSPGGRFAIDTSATRLSDRGRAPWTSEASRAANNPTLNLDNLTMPVLVNVSTGIVHPEELRSENPSAAMFLGGPVETGTFVMTGQLQAETVRRGLDNFEFRYDIFSGHTWPTWRRAAFDKGTIWTFLDRI